MWENFISNSYMVHDLKTNCGRFSNQGGKTLKRSIKAGLLGASLLMGAGASFAADPYVGASLGAFNIGTGVNKKAVTGGFIQLGDNFSEYLGGEIRVGASGSTGEEFPPQASSKIDWFAAAFVKPHYSFNEDWMGYGLLGVATVKASHTEPGFAKQTKTRTGYAYGLGVEYKAADQIGLNAEWSHMLSKPKATAATIQTNFQGVEASVFTVGIKYHFY